MLINAGLGILGIYSRSAGSRPLRQGHRRLFVKAFALPGTIPTPSCCRSSSTFATRSRRCPRAQETWSIAVYVWSARWSFMALPPARPLSHRRPGRPSSARRRDRRTRWWSACGDLRPSQRDVRTCARQRLAGTCGIRDREHAAIERGSRERQAVALLQIGADLRRGSSARAYLLDAAQCGFRRAGFSHRRTGRQQVAIAHQSGPAGDRRRLLERGVAAGEGRR